jgi:hypothetical protein
MAKLWLATDAPGRFSMRPFLANGLHLFSGEQPPSFDEGASQSNEECEYLGEVSADSVRGTLPEPGAFVETVLVLKGGVS